ncbi:unnamed protein product [Linum trigynum]|uniref:Uncharacterized protein n=1 Tax=Linum trigynum TaxID=586398 RepID=A0AAV2GES7_9ROSI
MNEDQEESPQAVIQENQTPVQSRGKGIPKQGHDGPAKDTSRTPTEVQETLKQAVEDQARQNPQITHNSIDRAALGNHKKRNQNTPLRKTTEMTTTMHMQVTPPTSNSVDPLHGKPNSMQSEHVLGRPPDDSPSSPSPLGGGVSSTEEQMCDVDGATPSGINSRSCSLPYLFYGF